MTKMENYGLDFFFTKQLTDENFQIGRITSESRSIYRMVTEDGEHEARVSGRYIYDTLHMDQYPKVGDFVEYSHEAGSYTIHRTLERKSVFKRKVAGERSDEQVVCANIDYAFLVMSCNSDFNPRRLERYLSIAYSGGATPVIVLTKSDLASSIDEYFSLAYEVSFGAQVVAVSAITTAGMDELEPFLEPGKTIAMLGSSGAGKSTLINTLGGSEIFKTNTTRKGDEKGKHTTTHREMVALPSGALVIDTPGMRELGMIGSESLLDSSFSDIEELSLSCRFSDCNHKSEPGCAVLEAIENGELDPERLKSYKKLGREMRIAQAKQNGNVRTELRKMHKERMAGKL